MSELKLYSHLITTFINIYTLLRGLAAELATVEVEPALRAVAIDGVDHGSDGRGLAVVVSFIQSLLQPLNTSAVMTAKTNILFVVLYLKCCRFCHLPESGSRHCGAF